MQLPRRLSILVLSAASLVGCDGGLDLQEAHPGQPGTPHAAMPGRCVAPELGIAGPATVHGRTPLGNFIAAGAWASNQCLSLTLKQVDDRGCLGQTLVVSTDLVVPPWPPLDGRPVPARVTAYAVDTPPPRDTGSATVVLEGGDFGEREGTLRGQLSARDGDWQLEGSFAATWRYAECK